VRALDLSELAIANAHKAWGAMPNVSWEVADIRGAVLPSCEYDVVIAYGLLHCLEGVS
jgi:hypothetical protein